jgi:hypothetical protein
VTDSRASSATSAWSCFVSHRLSIVNQKADGASVSKESQNRYSKTAKDWGWREFVTLTSLFDQVKPLPPGRPARTTPLVSNRTRVGMS